MIWMMGKVKASIVLLIKHFHSAIKDTGWNFIIHLLIRTGSFISLHSSATHLLHIKASCFRQDGRVQDVRLCNYGNRGNKVTRQRCDIMHAMTHVHTPLPPLSITLGAPCSGSGSECRQGDQLRVCVGQQDVNTNPSFSSITMIILLLHLMTHW